MPSDQTYYDEDTLFKVSDVLRHELGLTDQTRERIISALLNKGILFREGTKEEAMEDPAKSVEQRTDEEFRQALRDYADNKDEERANQEAEKPSVTPPNSILVYFEYEHLPAHLRDVSIHFHRMAHKLQTLLPNGPEKSVALRKLLESKDAAVRAAL